MYKYRKRNFLQKFLYKILHKTGILDSILERVDRIEKILDRVKDFEERNKEKQ